MSFEQQEAALFDLLFDQTLRDQFCIAQTTALQTYDLTPAELEDFKHIRPVALELDAKIRADLILSHLCTSFPVSFSIIALVAQGFAPLKQLIDTTTMHSPSTERAQLFGDRLHQYYPNLLFASEQEKTIATTILEVELGMVMTGTELKKQIINHPLEPIQELTLPQNWLAKPIQLGAHVSATIMPKSYQQLKNMLCVVADNCLWRQLNQTPFPASMRQQLSQYGEARLFVARADVDRYSNCEPVICHKTIELNEGFATLFEYIDGSITINQILTQLRNTGAQTSLLQQIQSVFQQLLALGILTFA